MHRSILLILVALTLIGSCKPKETPKPSSQNDDSLSKWVNPNVMAKQKHDGSIGESIRSRDGNILALGTDVSGKQVIWKINTVDGSIIWMKEIVDQNHVFTGITETDGTDIVVSGYRSLTQDSLIVRAYNSAGDEKWRRAFGEAYHAHGYSQIVSLSNTNLLVNNSTIRAGIYPVRMRQRLKLDADGNKVSGDFYADRYYADMIRTDNNDILAVDAELFIIRRFNENGEGINTNAINTSNITGSRAIKECPNGDLLVCGNVLSNTNGVNTIKAYVARFSSELIKLDYDVYSGVKEFNNIVPTDDGFIAVSGSDSGRAYMMACDHLGALLWERDCPSNQETEYASNIFRRGRYYVLVGNCSSNKFFVMGVDEDGNIHP